MQRTPVNPTEWGLQWSLNQAEVIEGATRMLHCSGQVALEADPSSEMGIRVIGEGDLRSQIASALANIDAILADAGMTRSDITTLRFFTTDIDGVLRGHGELGVSGQWSVVGGRWSVISG